MRKIKFVKYRDFSPKVFDNLLEVLFPSKLDNLRHEDFTMILNIKKLNVIDILEKYILLGRAVSINNPYRGYLIYIRIYKTLIWIHDKCNQIE